MPDPAALIAAAENIGETYEGLLTELMVQNTDQARIAACLYLTIAELHRSVVAVLRSQAPSHAPVLIRSMEEALADLTNLLADATYADQIRFANADQMLKTFKGFKDAPDLQDDEDAIKTLAEWIAKEQETFDQLKAKNFGSLLIADKFKKAGMGGEYATAYRWLCSFSHNNLNTLLGRHGAINENKLRFAAPFEPETLTSALGLEIGIYSRAVETLPKYTSVTDEKVKSVRKAAEEVWDATQAG